MKTSSESIPVILAGINARYRHTSFGLRCLKAALGEDGPRCEVMETTIKGNMERFAEELASHSPAIVGVGVYIWNVPEAEELIGHLRERLPNTVIVVGGPEVSHETAGQPVVEAADYTVCGEGEDAFTSLVRRILRGEKPEERIIDGGLPDLATLPSPYPLYTDEDIANRVVYVEASRGCPFKCQFCLSSLDKRVRQVPLDSFLEHMDSLIQRGAKDFKFIDRTFNLKMEVSTRILRFFLERVHLGLSLHFEMIPDRLPDPLKSLLGEFPPGVVQLEVGIQTFDVPTAKRIERRQNYELTESNLRYLTHETGVHLHTDLIVGLPGEDLDTFARGFDRLMAIGPQEIQVGILKRLKGTPIQVHDGEWEMSYNQVPPFDVLHTKVLSSEEAEEMKHFSRLWDRLANSGNFVEGLPLIWENEESPFVAFRKLVNWILKRHGRSYGIPLVELHRECLTYLTEEVGVAEVRVREALHRDYHRTPGRKTPRFLHVEHPVKNPKVSGEGGPLRRQERHMQGQG